jgi:hypothetical protein
MIDTVVPGLRDYDITLLYQTEHLKDIVPGGKASAIVKDGNRLTISHIHPERVTAKAVETPHYLYTLQRERPLERQGMLTVTSRTNRNPLVMANLLACSPENRTPSVESNAGDGYVYGSVDGMPFVVSTRPGMLFRHEGMFETDALAGTGWDGGIFAAMCTILRMNGNLAVESEQPMTFELSGGRLKYYLCAESAVVIGSPSRPQSVTVNGIAVTNFRYDANRQALSLVLPAGEGVVTLR